MAFAALRAKEEEPQRLQELPGRPLRGQRGSSSSGPGREGKGRGVRAGATAGVRGRGNGRGKGRASPMEVEEAEDGEQKSHEEDEQPRGLAAGEGRKLHGRGEGVEESASEVERSPSGMEAARMAPARGGAAQGSVSLGEDGSESAASESESGSESESEDLGAPTQAVRPALKRTAAAPTGGRGRLARWVRSLWDPACQAVQGSSPPCPCPCLSPAPPSLLPRRLQATAGAVSDDGASAWSSSSLGGPSSGSDSEQQEVGSDQEEEEEEDLEEAQRAAKRARWVQPSTRLYVSGLQIGPMLRAPGHLPYMGNLIAARQPPVALFLPQVWATGFCYSITH